MEAAILILGLLFMLLAGLGVYAGVKVVRAAARGVDRTVAQARRTVEDTTLKAKTYAQLGTGGELAQLRLELRTSMRATQQALHGAATEDASLSEALGLFERLSAHGHELDDDLKRLEREPSKTRIAEQLPELRERTQRVTHSAESLRWASQDRARQFADDDLVSLGQQIDLEAGALRHWASDPLLPEEATATTGPDPVKAQPARSEPQAITDRSPLRDTVYPWQKTPRPEGTT